METVKSYTRLARNLIPLPIKRFIYRTGRFFGSEPLDTYPSIQASLSILKNRGFYPKNCIDVGAYKGDWTDIFKLIFPETKILMIEPQKDKKIELKSKTLKYKNSVSYEMALLAEKSGKKVIFYQMETGSSILPELTHHPRQAVEMITETVDNIVSRHKDFNNLDFLKLDAQGYEIEILKGAENTLKNTKALLLEVSIVPYNEGGPLISEVFDFLDKKGFQLFDFCSQSRRLDGILVQTDLLFVHRNSGLLPKPGIAS